MGERDIVEPCRQDRPVIRGESIKAKKQLLPDKAGKIDRHANIKPVVRGGCEGGKAFGVSRHRSERIDPPASGDIAVNTVEDTRIIKEEKADNIHETRPARLPIRLIRNQSRIEGQKSRHFGNCHGLRNVSTVGSE